MTEFEILNLTASRGNPVFEIEFAVASLRARGGTLMKILHGGKQFRQDVRKCLRSLQKTGRISVFIPGERFDREDIESQYLLNKFPSVGTDPDLDAANDNISVICL